MKTTQFTNMRIFTYLLKYFLIFLFATFISCSNNKDDSDKWIKLFNGKDLTEWKIKFAGHELNDNYKNTFQVSDGVLKVSYDEYDNFDGKFGHIFYNKKFSHYIIRVEYRFIG